MQKYLVGIMFENGNVAARVAGFRASLDGISISGKSSVLYFPDNSTANMFSRVLADNDLPCKRSSVALHGLVVPTRFLVSVW